MGQLATTSQRSGHKIARIGLTIARDVLRRRVRSSLLAMTGVIALSASAFAQNQASLESLSRDPAQWVMAPHDYASTRFSSLDQINAGNAAQLNVAWSFSLGADRGQEAAPLIINNTMYVVGPYAGPHPNQV